MKKMKYMLLMLLMLTMLFGCSAEPLTSGETVTKAATEQTEQTEQTEAAVNIAAEDYIFPLYEDELFRTDLLLYLSEDGALCCVLRGIPYTDAYVFVNCSDICVNGSICEDSEFFSLSSDSVGYKLLEDVSIADAPITSFSCNIEARCDEANYDRSEFVQISIPESFQPHLVCEEVFDAKADRQILSENDRVKITLICAGNILGSDLIYSRKLDGVILVENKTEKTIPVKISAAAVNQTHIKVTSSPVFLPAHTQTFLNFSVPETELKAQSIASIYDLSLQILTDEEENTGMNFGFAMDGGEWYPVMLFQAGIAMDEMVIGELLFENELLQIGCIGQEETENYNGEICYTWKLIIKNKSDQNLTLHAVDQKINGKTADEYAFVLYDDIGAGKYRSVNVSVELPEGTPRPELSFLLQVSSMGGGTLLFTTKELIVLSSADQPN